MNSVVSVGFFGYGFGFVTWFIVSFEGIGKLAKSVFGPRSEYDLTGAFGDFVFVRSNFNSKRGGVFGLDY